jgi:tetratricopeptide (TPR) repeat protein
MSVIYKSLKQVRKEERERKKRPRPVSPEAVAPSYQRILKRFAGYVVLIGIFLWVTMFWLQAEVRRIVAVTAEQVEATATIRRAQEDPVQQAVAEQAVVVSDVRPIERMAPVAERRPAPLPQTRTVVSSPGGAPTGSAPAPGQIAQPAPARTPAPLPRQTVELDGPSQELERYFSAQALRNNELLTLERSVEQQQIPTAVAALELEQRLGPQSMYTLRRGGYEALTEGNFALAEDFFRQALARNPRDKDTRMNLVLTLIAQDKRQEARQMFDRLAGDYPMDEQVVALGRGL